MDKQKFQITNHKYQTNNNDQNSKLETCNVEVTPTRISNLFCHLDIGI